MIIKKNIKNKFNNIVYYYINFLHINSIPETQSLIILLS